jgi:hypothetical protein
VTAPQYEAIPAARPASSEIWYVYLAAILLISWSTLVLWELISLRRFDFTFWRAVVPFAVELVIGFGLLFRRRWAWIVGVSTAVVFIAEGFRRLLFVHFEYEWAVALIDYLVPAIVILVCLLPGRARSAFLGE